MSNTIIHRVFCMVLLRFQRCRHRQPDISSSCKIRATLSNHHFASDICGSISDITAQSADGIRHSDARDIFVSLQHRQTKQPQTSYNGGSHTEVRCTTMMSLHPSCWREGAGNTDDRQIRLEEGWPSTRNEKSKADSYGGFCKQAALVVDHFAPGEHRMLSIRVRAFDSLPPD